MNRDRTVSENEPYIATWEYSQPFCVKVEGWQLCPKCNGYGEVCAASSYCVCDVCKGKKIINLATGKPPEN